MALDKLVDSAALDAALSDIADAIRAKTGDSGTMTIDEMPGEIATIPGGDIDVERLDVTENGTYTAPQGKAYSPVVANVPTGTPRDADDVTVNDDTVSVPAGLYDDLVSKSVAAGSVSIEAVMETPSNHSVKVHAEATKHKGWIEDGNVSDSGVTVHASDLVSGKKQITDTTEQDVTNYETAQVVDANLVPANIKKDVAILGVVGTHEGGGVTPSGKLNITDTAVKDVTNYAQAQVVDANLVAGNIKKGVTVLGIVGTHEGGTTPVLVQKTITQNGTYDPADDNADGYSEVVVNVSGGGGDDGYLRIGGRIFYDTYDDYGDNGATYRFFDANKTEITYTGDIDDLEYAVYYKVTGVPKFDRFYVFDNTSHGSGDYAAVDGIVRSVVWGMLEVLTQHNIWDNDPDFCNKIGSGKALSALTLARCEEEQHYGDYGGIPTIWQYINHCNATRLNGCGDWFILSRGEHEALRDSGLVSWYQRGATPMDNLFLWSSVEYDVDSAWSWDSGGQTWFNDVKGIDYSCFAARAF